MKDVKSRVAEILSPMRKPSVMLEVCKSVVCDGESTSHLGGRPPSFPGFVWPEWQGRPLGFVACLDLGRFSALPWLPKSGRLLFFYDLVKQPWGTYPSERGAWKVQHVPEGTLLKGLAPFPNHLRAQHWLPVRAVTFRVASVPPPYDLTPMAAQDLPDEEMDQICDAVEALRDAEYGQGPRHQVGGYPDPVQGADMELACEIRTRGIDDRTLGGRDDPRVKALEAEAAHWRLLLQVDSDRALGVMWGDCGRIYFWVREQDARRGDFSNVWLQLQCC
jgi:uncharacterized protein YwqG